MEDAQKTCNKQLHIEFYKINCTYKYFSSIPPGSDAEKVEKTTRENFQKDGLFPTSLRTKETLADNVNQSQNYASYFKGLKLFVELILATNIELEEAYKIVIWGLKKEKVLVWMQGRNETLINLLKTIKLPRYTGFNMQVWQEWLSKTSPSQDLPKLLQAFTIADSVFPQNKEQAIKIGKSVEKYGDQLTRQNLPAALFGVSHEIEKDILSLYLQIKINDEDNIPDIDNDIVIRRQKPDNGVFAHYRLMKLKKKDPAILSIGAWSECCLRFKEAGHSYLVDALEKSNNGFYILVEDQEEGLKPLYDQFGNFNIKSTIKIVGVGYSWISIQGNIVIDSWENKGLPLESEHSFYNKVIEDLLQKWASQLFKKFPTIYQLSIGVGGKTPECFKTSKKLYLPQVMLEGKPSNDSIKQVLVAQSQESLQIIEKLKNSFGKYFPTSCIAPSKNLNKLFKELMMHHSSIQKLLSVEEIRTNFGNALVICQSEGKISMHTYESVEKIMKILNKKSLLKLTKTHIILFWKNQICFSALLDLNDENLIETISSGKTAVIEMEKIIQKLNLLIDDQALPLYRKNIIKFSQLASIDSNDQIKFLISPEAKCLYEHSVSIPELSDLYSRLQQNHQAIKSLVCENAILALDFGLSFRVLEIIYTLNRKIFDKTLEDCTDDKFLLACCFDELASGLQTQNEIINSIRDGKKVQNYEEMTRIYMRFKTNFPSLIGALNSYDVKELYRHGGNFAFFVRAFERNSENFGDLIGFLTSKQSFEIYKLGANCSSLERLFMKEKSDSQILNQIDFIKDEYRKLNLIGEINEFIDCFSDNYQAFQQITTILSLEMRKILQELKIRFQALFTVYLHDSKNFPDIMKLWTRNLVENIKTLNLKGQDIIQLVLTRNLEETKILLSQNAFYFYQTGWATLNQLKVISSQEKLNTIISQRVKSISHFIGFSDLERIYDEYPQKFETLISKECIGAKYIGISELARYSEEEIKDLTCQNTRLFMQILTSCDENVKLSFETAKGVLLKFFSDENERKRFHILTSEPALELYKKGIKFGELKDLLKTHEEKGNIEKFKLFISHPSVVNAIQFMKPQISFRSIGKLVNEVSSPQIFETLLSKESLQRVKTGESFKAISES